MKRGNKAGNRSEDGEVKVRILRDANYGIPLPFYRKISYLISKKGGLIFKINNNKWSNVARLKTYKDGKSVTLDHLGPNPL